MKNRYILTSLDDYVVFTDVNDREVLCAITKEEQKRKMEIVRKYGYKDEDVPDEHTVKAYRMGMIENNDPYHDKYDIIDKVNTIDFPINKIYWVWIQLLPTNR